MPQHTCPKCHAQQARRIRQQGFLQQAILRRFGYYPWECRFCKETFVLKDRGVSAGSRRQSGSSSTAETDSVAAG